MIPAAFAMSLPVSQNLDPFEIFFILDKADYKKNRGWINRLNKDKTLTSGLFNFQVYPKELIFQTKAGEKIKALLNDSNVIASTIHPNKKIIHVEHQWLDLKDGDTENFRFQLNLFILKLLRANLDEVREMIYFGHRGSRRSYNSVEENKSLQQLENNFERLIKVYAPKIDKKDARRLRSFRNTAATPKIDRSSSSYEPVSRSFHSFHVSSSFGDYYPTEVNRDFLNELEVAQNEEGNLVITPEVFKNLLIKGRFIIGGTKEKPDPWIQPESVKINLIKGSSRGQREKFPVLDISIGHLRQQIRLKNHEGTIIYVATLLKRKFNESLKREEIINIFKDISPKSTEPIKRNTLKHFIKKENIPAYKWIKEIYSLIFEEASFDNWMYKLFTCDGDQLFRMGLSLTKKHIGNSLYQAGYEKYTPFINIESKKNGRAQIYFIDVMPDNIELEGLLQTLKDATLTYLNSKTE